MEKEYYIVRFPTQERANYWMREFCEKFKDDIMSINKSHHSVELIDSVYYFWTDRMLQGRIQRKATEYDESAIYIILDDPEQKRYVTFHDEDYMHI